MKYYNICDYDGKENIVIDHELYESDSIFIKIKAVLNNAMTNDDKIIELNKLLDIFT